MIRLKRLDFEYDIYIYIEKDIIGYRCCGRVSCFSPQLVGIVRMCLGLKLIRHMWEASLSDVGLSKTVRHSQSGQYLLIGG